MVEKWFWRACWHETSKEHVIILAFLVNRCSPPWHIFALEISDFEAENPHQTTPLLPNLFSVQLERVAFSVKLWHVRRQHLIILCWPVLAAACSQLLYLRLTLTTVSSHWCYAGAAPSSQFCSQLTHLISVTTSSTLNLLLTLNPPFLTMLMVMLC